MNNAIKAMLASRSSEERSRCMKRTWRKKRKVMLAGVLKHLPENRKKANGPKHRIAVSKALKEKWKIDPAFARMVIEKNLSKGRANPSECQKDLFNRLNDWKHITLKLDFRVDRFWIDIADPKRKLGIEVDGSYWHDRRKPGNDQRRDRKLRSLGWKILRVDAPVSEGDIRKCIRFMRCK